MKVAWKHGLLFAVFSVLFHKVAPDPAFNNMPSSIGIEETLALPTHLITMDTYGVYRPYTYSIEWGLSDPVSGAAPFTIYSNNGSIWYNANFPMNYDNRPDYTLHVCATDSQAVPVEVCEDLTINVIDLPNVPSWQSLPATVTIPESIAIGSMIHVCVASDPDITDVVTYSINSALPEAAPIAISSLTGKVTVVGAFDFETTPLYTVTVQATDGTTPVLSTLTIQLTDVLETPSLSLDPIVDVPETSPNGLWYQHNDPNEAAGTTYKLKCKPASCPFVIDPATGDIYIDDTQGLLDYQKQQDFRLTVTIKDPVQGDIDSVHQINIIPYNDPPYFLANETTFWETVPEQTILNNVPYPAGNNILKVVAGDPEDDVLEYYMTVQPDPGTISIDVDTGYISYTASPGFNYEKEPLHTLVIHVSDGTTMIGPQYFYLNVTDEMEPPIIKNLPDSMCLSEEIQDTVSFFGLVYDDEDKYDRDVWGMTVTGGPFGINNNTGVISTAGDPNFDFNVISTYTLDVTVEDSYTLTDTETLTVCVGGQAPRGPQFNVRGPDFVTKDEEQTVNAQVTGINLGVTDRDLNNGDVLTWTMETTPGSENFWFDTSSTPPKVRWNAVIDREALSGPIFYNLKFTVTDVTPGETDVKYATIVVADADDNDPVFLKTRYTATIQENLPTDSYVTAVTANDADQYINQKDPLQYSISGGNMYFKIDATTGVIYVKNSPDYETVQSVSLNVIVTDDGGHTDTTTVDITITDLNDNAPVLDSLYYNFEVRNDAVLDYAVGQIGASDVDTVGVNLFFLETVSAEFYMENKTGLIRVKNAGILVNDTEYTLKAVVRDTETVPHKSLVATIRIDAYPYCLNTITLDIATIATYYPKTSTVAGFTGTNMDYFLDKISGMFGAGTLARIVTVDDQEWPIFDGIGKGKSVSQVSIVVLSDSSTETITSVNNIVKSFYNTTELLTEMQDLDPELPDGSNLPSSQLSAAVGSRFPVDNIWETEECPPEPLHWWTETPEGITTQSFIAMACFLGLGALLSLFMYMCGKRLLFGPYPSCKSLKDMCKKKPKVVKPKPKPEPPKGDDKLPDFRYAKKDPAKYFKNYDANVSSPT